jgi:H+/Cl- antiporter ClcA
MDTGVAKMNGKTLLHIIFRRLIFMILSVIVAGLIAGITAFIVSNITDNIDTIVKSCLISVWTAEIILMALFGRIAYNKKIKLFDTNDGERLKKEKGKLKRIYILSTAIFSVFLGFVLYNVKEQLIKSENGTGQVVTEEIIDSPTFYLKILITVVLIIFFIIRIILQKNRKK